MIWMVLAILGLLGALIAYMVFRSSTGEETRRDSKIVSRVSFPLFFVFLLIGSVTIIPAGHVGVPVLFGSVRTYHLNEGLHFVNPILKIVKMSVRTQEIKETADVPSSEGLTVTVESSLLFNLNPEVAPNVYQTLGENYIEVFVEPQFRSHLRGVTAEFEAKALYTSQREIISSRLEQSLAPILAQRGIINHRALLRKIILPEAVIASINAKSVSEQDAQRMEFVLQKEKQEAERKRIEARGIADFQKIVVTSLTPRLLEWKGIEATERLAASQKAKIVIVGGGKNGLPIIFNVGQ